MALNLGFNPVKRFTQPAVSYYAEQFSAGGKQRWRGFGKFDLESIWNSRLGVQAQQFEYRQFIRGWSGTASGSTTRPAIGSRSIAESPTKTKRSRFPPTRARR